MKWQIIAGMSLGGTISPCRETLTVWVKSKCLKRWVSKQEVGFMVTCEMGRTWEALADCPVLFRIDDHGENGYLERCGYDYDLGLPKADVTYLAPEKPTTGSEEG